MDASKFGCNKHPLVMDKEQSAFTPIVFGFVLEDSGDGVLISLS